MLRLLVAAILLGSSAALSACGGDRDRSRDGEPASDGATRGAFGEIPQVVRRIRPSVVAVLVRTPEGNGEGSGVVWDYEGTVVTNHHVVARALEVRVGLASGERLPAEVRASDPRTDLATLKVDRRGLPAARFERGLPQVGELAVAVGNPLGFENTVTAGIVSGLDREIPTGGRTPSLVGLLQTDAAISPGNSGGALVDRDGNVIGINVAYIPPQARAVSIGFAIPSQVVIDVVGQLLARGEANHAFLGVALEPISPDIADRLDLDTTEGAIVYQAASQAPAARAGIRPGDIIVEIAGRRIRAVEDVFSALRTKRPGEVVEVRFLRGGTARTTSVRLAELPG